MWVVCSAALWWAKGNLLQESLCHMLRDACLLQSVPLPPCQATQASTGDTQTLKSRSDSVSMASLLPGAHRVLFEQSEYLWWVWVLILNVILPLPPSCWGISFFFGEIQHSSNCDCSSASCNFGVLAEDEHTSFYSTILFILQSVIL